MHPAYLSCYCHYLQAVWRGYILRLKLSAALEFARMQPDMDDDIDEFDMSQFNFDEVTAIWLTSFTVFPSLHRFISLFDSCVFEWWLLYLCQILTNLVTTRNKCIT